MIEKNKKKRMIIFWLFLFEKLFEKDISFIVDFIFMDSQQSHYLFDLNKKNLMPTFKFDAKNDDLFLFSGSFNQYDGSGINKTEYIYNKGGKENISLLVHETINIILYQYIDKPTSYFYKKIDGTYRSIKSIESKL